MEFGHSLESLFNRQKDEAKVISVFTDKINSVFLNIKLV